MLLRNGAERIRDFVNLENVESDYLAVAGLEFERASSDLLSCSIVVSRNAVELFGTRLDDGQDRTE